MPPRSAALQTATRRRFLAYGLAAATGATIARDARAAAPNSVCTLAAQQEVGPFYIPDELLREDIREGQPGLPLSLELVILNAHTCVPIPNAAVDIWQCNAMGLYSGYTHTSMGPPPGGRPRFEPRGGPEGSGGPPGPPPDPGSPSEAAGPLPPPNSGFGPPPGPITPTDAQTFLRGIQLTSPTGVVRFTTIVPGCYPGRTNHIHFRVRLGAHPGQRTYPGGHLAHTGQVFLPESLVAPLMASEPYRSHHLARIPLDRDNVFQTQQGNRMLARTEAPDQGKIGAALTASLLVAIDPDALAPSRNAQPNRPETPSRHLPSGS